jgi:hypothetical protein
MTPSDSAPSAGAAGVRHGGACEPRFMNRVFTIGAPNARAGASGWFS